MCLMNEKNMNEYKKWKQTDVEFNQEEAWPEKLFPDAKFRYFSECGCVVTSLAIMLRHFGLEPEADPEKFNPWILNEWLIRCEAFTKSADLIINNISKIYPLEYVGMVPYSKEEALKLCESAEPFLITVPGTNAPRHFIVPDCVENGELKVFDCYGNNQSINDYEKVFDLRVFRKKDVKKEHTNERPMIALTFDDGPGYNSCSKKITKLLEQFNAKATFFMIGKNVHRLPKTVSRRLALGFEIGNHTWDHDRYGSHVTREDIIKANREIEKACGKPPACFRSPGGKTNEFIRDICKQSNLPLFHWSVDTNDWKYKDPDWIYRIVVNSVKDGDIVLMHEIYNSTYYALERILPELTDRGFQFVTCSELIYAKTGKAPEPGVQYCRASSVYNNTK